MFIIQVNLAPTHGYKPRTICFGESPSHIVHLITSCKIPPFHSPHGKVLLVYPDNLVFLSCILALCAVLSCYSPPAFSAGTIAADSVEFENVTAGPPSIVGASVEGTNEEEWWIDITSEVSYTTGRSAYLDAGVFLGDLNV